MKINMDIVTAAEVQEAICRGEGCMSCGQNWKKVEGKKERELLHLSDCSYTWFVDEMERVEVQEGR